MRSIIISHDWPRLFMIGTSLMVLYYISDAAMDAILFDEGTVYGQLFTPNRHELAIRLLSGTFFFTFFLFARHLLRKNQLLQQNLLKKSQELIAANLEGEAFTHAFSTEIKASLDIIFDTVKKLSDKHGQELSAEGHTLIRHSSESCKKMSSQIIAALDLSQAIRAKLVYQQTSLNQLVQEVAKDIISGVNDITVSIETERNINISCDPDLMRLAVKNLCLCAINHCKPNKQAEISIGAETRHNQQTFFIRHNGPGFVAENNIRQFEFPGLLSALQETSGKSTGLPVVKTIIQRHGGQIWSENNQGAGAAFCFTL